MVKHEGSFQTNQTAVQYFGFVLTLRLGEELGSMFLGHAISSQALPWVDSTHSVRVLCLFSTLGKTRNSTLLEAEGKPDLKVQSS